MNAECPACRSQSTSVILRVDVAPTSDGVLVKAPVDTTICSDCGFAFNSAGARGNESAFYAESYDLLSESSDSEFVYEAAGELRGINGEMSDYVLRRVNVGLHSSVLDIGCGKGLLLREFKKRRSDLELFGVEPSRQARRFSVKNIPEALIHVGVLENSPFASKEFDLILCVGVFEHVADPVGFARRLAARLRDDGRLFVSVPNFADNPADVVTFDHLSRFTSTTLRSVLSRAGLMVEEIVAGGRVPMWALARRLKSGELPETLIDDSSIATNAASWFRECLREYGRLSRHVRLNDGKIGVYGTGLIFPSAVALGEVSSDDVVAFFDDNVHMHGSERLGCTVLPLSEVSKVGITDLTFSANPVYVSRMESKVRTLYPHIRIWPIPVF